jgi:hypothetical protein
MNESLIQQFYLNDDGSLSCKVLSLTMIMTLVKEAKSPGKSRASSRGNTGGASVTRNNWA